MKQYLHQCDAKIAAFWRSVKEVPNRSHCPILLYRSYVFIIDWRAMVGLGARRRGVRGGEQGNVKIYGLTPSSDPIFRIFAIAKT